MQRMFQCLESLPWWIQSVQTFVGLKHPVLHGQTKAECAQHYHSKIGGRTINTEDNAISALWPDVESYTRFDQEKGHVLNYTDTAISSAQQG